MGSRKGIPNRRTLLRQANIREAAARAQLNLDSDDELVRADSLAIMEHAMSYFYRLALKERRRRGSDLKVVRENFCEAVAVAKEVAPYRHPRLSSVKVGGDRPNPLELLEGKTSQQAMVELVELIKASGVMPKRVAAMMNGGDVINVSPHRLENGSG